MGGGDPGPRNPILQGPVLPSFCRVTSAWLFCCSSLHSCSRARVCSASRGFLASFAFRGGQAGGTTGAAPSSGPDLHHRSSHCPTSTLLPLAPSCPQPPPPPRRPVSAVPPPVPILPIPTAPDAPNPHPGPNPPHCPVGPLNMAGQGRQGTLMGCWVPWEVRAPGGGSGCSPPLPSPCRCRAAQMRSG